MLWFDLIRQLSYQWSTNEQYAYGWFVPVLALGLFIKKWPLRPRIEPEDKGPGVGPPAVLWLLFGSLVVLMPLRVIYEINPDWPLISWSYALIVVATTLYAIHLAGPTPSSSGVVSPWVTHFFFPVCFILVAVRWTSWIEGPLTQGLMRLDAAITVELLGWLNIPALQRGNLIELATGTVGVNEACSGIRSFQSTLMAALFLGELYVLRWRPRILMVLGGLTLAFAFNVARTLLLSYQANNAGMGAIEKWHDPAGFTIAIASFLCLWVVAVLITKWTTSNVKVELPVAVAAAAAKPLPTSGLPASLPNPQSACKKPVPAPWPLVSRYLLAVGLWSLLCIGVTEIWYGRHDGNDEGFVRWSVSLPETKPGFEKLEMPPKVLELLRYDSGGGAKWQDEDGSEWTAYSFRWDGRSMKSIMSARFHSPEICLPASGFQQLSHPEVEYFQVGSVKLPFQKSTYVAQGKEIHVFYCVWQDGDERRKGTRSDGRRDRLLMAIEGRKQIGQQTLELIVSGHPEMSEAERLFRQRLPTLIRIEPQPGVATPQAYNKSGQVNFR